LVRSDAEYHYLDVAAPGNTTFARDLTSLRGNRRRLDIIFDWRSALGKLLSALRPVILYRRIKIRLRKPEDGG